MKESRSEFQAALDSAVGKHAAEGRQNANIEFNIYAPLDGSCTVSLVCFVYDEHGSPKPNNFTFLAALFGIEKLNPSIFLPG